MTNHSPNSTAHTRSLLLIGGGGHATVVAEAAVLSGWRIVGFLDDDKQAPLSKMAEWIGSIATIENPELTEHHPTIIAVGDLRFRRKLVEIVRDDFAIVIHPDASVSPSATIGEGVFIGPGAVVHTNATLGAHATVNSGAIVEHDVVIGPNAHLAPGAVLGGAVQIGAGTLIGIGARVIPGVHIGSDAVVGAGAAVIRDTPDGACVVGVPASEIGVRTE